MRKLNITDKILDKLGFSEYSNKYNDNWGCRTLTFSNNIRFRIIEQEEMDDEHEGYGYLCGSEATYVANHFYFSGLFAIPKIDTIDYNLFFLHEMYECIEKEYPDCLEEFIAKCKDLNMKPYIDEYLIERELLNESVKDDTYTKFKEVKEEEKEEWTTTSINCDLCGYKWQAVHHIDCEILECPNCHNMTTIF